MIFQNLLDVNNGVGGGVGSPPPPKKKWTKDNINSQVFLYQFNGFVCFFSLARTDVNCTLFEATLLLSLYISSHYLDHYSNQTNSIIPQNDRQLWVPLWGPTLGSQEVWFTQVDFKLY